MKTLPANLNTYRSDAELLGGHQRPLRRTLLQPQPLDGFDRIVKRINDFWLPEGHLQREAKARAAIKLAAFAARGENGGR